MSAARVGDVVAFRTCPRAVLVAIDGDAVRYEHLGSVWVDDGSDKGRHDEVRTGDVRVMPAWVFDAGLLAGHWRVER